MWGISGTHSQPTLTVGAKCNQDMITSMAMAIYIEDGIVMAFIPCHSTTSTIKHQADASREHIIRVLNVCKYSMQVVITVLIGIFI